MLKLVLILISVSLITAQSVDSQALPGNIFHLLHLRQKWANVPNLIKQKDIDNIRSQIPNFLSSFKSTNSVVNISSSCMSHLSNFSQGVLNYEDWALQILDSLGKPPAGIINGALNWLGDYRQCINESIATFPRKYCYVSNTLIPFKYGICVSQACTYDDLYQMIYFLLFISQISIPDDSFNYVVCQEPKELDWKAIMAISIVAVIAAYVIMATIYDYFQIFSNKKTRPEQTLELKETKKSREDATKQKKSKLHQILIDSSIYTNTKKLFDLKESKEQLNCLNGIRFLSLSWVILGHTYSFLYTSVNNLSYFDELSKRFPFMIVLNGILAVDTFFLLSGLLSCYLFLKTISKTKLSFKLMIKFYLHRYLRITPVYMIALMLSATLSKYTGTGPTYPPDGFEIEQCKNTWYLNLLYVNNIIKGDKQCLPVSWYLANDMQFHWLSPLILIPFALKKPIIGIIVSVLFLVANLTASVVIISQNPGFEFGTFGGNPDFFVDAYITPWFRIGPFIVGILLGYIIYQKKTSKKPNYINPVTNIILWILSLFLLCLMVFGNFKNFSGDRMQKWLSIFYESTAKLIWSVGLSYLIFACVTENGGVVNRILSCKIWKPLAKISFSVYLIHTYVLTHVIATELRPIFIEDTMMIYRFLGNLVLSLLAGYLVYVFFELPIAAFEKHIFKS